MSCEIVDKISIRIGVCTSAHSTDKLGIPHKPHKQVFGTPLTIIGIDVDANNMRLMLPDEVRNRLIEELRFWAAKPPKSSSGAFKLKYWERLAGWFNWALNVYPLLCPALNNFYAKMNGKHNRYQGVYINNAIRSDFECIRRMSFFLFGLIDLT